MSSGGSIVTGCGLRKGKGLGGAAGAGKAAQGTEGRRRSEGGRERGREASSRAGLAGNCCSPGGWCLRPPLPPGCRAGPSSVQPSRAQPSRAEPGHGPGGAPQSHGASPSLSRATGTTGMSLRQRHTRVSLTAIRFPVGIRYIVSDIYILYIYFIYISIIYTIYIYLYIYPDTHTDSKHFCDLQTQFAAAACLQQ